MKQILFLFLLLLLCSTSLTSCKSNEAEADLVAADSVGMAYNEMIITDVEYQVPQTLDLIKIEAFVTSGKGRFITNRLAIIKYSKIADSLVYWTYQTDNRYWYFLDNK